MTVDTLCRALIACGGLYASVGVALSAYAAHVVDASARGSLQSAALFALLHGVALAVLPRQVSRRIGFAALLMLATGAALFSGAIVAAHVFGTPTRLAPFGGSLLIFGWLLFAIDAIRR